MHGIKIGRVGSRFEIVSAEELYALIPYQQGLFVLTFDERLLPVGSDADWRAAVYAMTGKRPPSGDTEGDPRELDLAALESAFAGDY